MDKTLEKEITLVLLGVKNWEAKLKNIIERIGQLINILKIHTVKVIIKT